MFGKTFWQTESLVIRFVNKEGADEPCNMQRYVPEVGGLCAAIGGACGVLYGDKVAQRVTMTSVGSKDDDPSSITLLVNYRHTVWSKIRSLFRQGRASIPLRALRSMGLLGGNGFIQSKLWIKEPAEFMVAVNVKDNEIYVVCASEPDEMNTARKLKIDADIANLLSSSVIHEGMHRFVAPLRCGAISGVIFESNEQVMLSQEDASSFDFGSMRVEKLY